MKYKLIVGGVLSATLLLAGAAFAAERGGQDSEREGDRPSLAQNAQSGGDQEGRVARPQDLGKLQDGEAANQEDNASGSAQVREQERSKEQEQAREQDRERSATSSDREQNTEREQNREENRSATSSDGERNMEREQNREQERSATSSDEESATSTEGERQREMHRSAVATAVQQLLSVADRDGGIGEEVRTIAKAQEENHAKINDSLKKVEQRSAIAKFFFGADQGEIDKAQQIVATNEAQIQQLTDLKARMATGTDQSIIDSQITLLKNVNNAASTTLTDSAKGFSLFGWMFRIFGR